MVLQVILTKNDGLESFTLQATRVSRTLDQSLVQEAVMEALGDLTGSDPEINTYTLEVDGVIQDVSASDYPNSGDYSDHDFGMENELARAVEEWGPSAANGFTVFTWGDSSKYTGTGANPREIDVVLTTLETTEDTEAHVAGAYEFSLTGKHVDIYVG